MLEQPGFNPKRGKENSIYALFTLTKITFLSKVVITTRTSRD